MFQDRRLYGLQKTLSQLIWNSVFILGVSEETICCYSNGLRVQAELALDMPNAVLTRPGRTTMGVRGEKNGRKYSAADKRLRVHRNTVAYRIDRMRELFGADFSDEYQNLQNYFGCLLLTLGREAPAEKT